MATTPDSLAELATAVECVVSSPQHCRHDMRKTSNRRYNNVFSDIISSGHSTVWNITTLFCDVTNHAKQSRSAWVVCRVRLSVRLSVSLFFRLFIILVFVLSICRNEVYEKDQKHTHKIDNHRQRGSDCTVLTATGLVNGEWQIKF